MESFHKNPGWIIIENQTTVSFGLSRFGPGAGSVGRHRLVGFGISPFVRSISRFVSRRWFVPFCVLRPRAAFVVQSKRRTRRPTACRLRVRLPLLVVLRSPLRDGGRGHKSTRGAFQRGRFPPSFPQGANSKEASLEAKKLS